MRHPVVFSFYPLLFEQGNLVLFVHFHLVPSEPRDVSLEVISHTQLRLSWNTPSDKNGLISGYYIRWKILRNDTNHTVSGQFDTATVDENMKIFDIEDLGKHYITKN